MKSVIVVLAVFVFGLLSVAIVGNQPVFAVTRNYKPVIIAKTAEPSPTPTPAPTEVNSFELFWPLAAGRTADQSFYFLKQWKEKLRGLLIFGTPQKLDYSVMLATKRVLEAEKLLNEGKTDVAKTTLNMAQDQLNRADSYVDDAKKSGESIGDVSQQVGSRLTNITKLLDWLASKSDNSSAKDMLTQVSSKAGSISSKL